MTTPTPTPIDDGGAAFPLYAPESDFPEYMQPGMTLRDHFAAQETLIGFDMGVDKVPVAVAEILAGPMPGGEGFTTIDAEHQLAMLKWQAKWRAAIRYIRADAMIAARKEAL